MPRNSENPSDLLKNPVIQDFLKNNPHAVKQVTAAARLLANNDDGDAALIKLLPALGNKIINAFFSYKKKDEETVLQIIQKLRELSAEKLNIVHQDEFDAGMNWRDAITSGIKYANWFILLLPDPSDDWDWCLFETGLFVARATSADRLICLHHPNIDRPSQISDFESIPATQDDVERFLRMALIEDNPIPGLSALNKAAEKSINKHAMEIVNVIRPPSSSLCREIFEPYIELRIENPEGLASKEDLDVAPIISSNKAALDIFDYLKQPNDWGSLHETISIKTDDHRWRNELYHVIQKIGKGRKFFPVQAVFQSINGKMYKPVVNAINRNGEEDSIESFFIVFAEEVSVIDETETPRDITLVVYMLRISFRFRWEVLEKFTKQPLKEDDIPLIDNALRRIKVDSESRGIRDDNDFLKAFPKENWARIEEMVKEWNAVHNPSGKGTLDIAIENKDPDKIQKILKKFIPMNQEFLEIASNQLASLLHQNLPANEEKA